MKHYLVQNINNSEHFWSELFGWVKEYHSTIFNETEQEKFKLPQNGQWFELKELPEETDDIPF